jgi:ABC-type nitrate/sulfonate/bicarbonate transport system substrate-binding protein
LESGVVDVVFVDSVYSKILKQKGMNILAKSSELKQPLVSQSTVVPGAFLQKYPDVAEGYLKSEIEGIAFAVAPKNKPAVIKTLMRRLRSTPKPRRKATRTCSAASIANLSLHWKGCAISTDF